jgi:hypothetical protein
MLPRDCWSQKQVWNSKDHEGSREIDKDSAALFMRYCYRIVRADTLAASAVVVDSYTYRLVSLARTTALPYIPLAISSSLNCSI